MAEHYDVILTKRYSISCIDNFVEMYTIKPGQKIVVEMNLLRVVEDESFVESDSESGSGSGSDVESDIHESNTETENQTDVHEEINNSCDTNDVEILERCD
jgi:hypothetical protein